MKYTNNNMYDTNTISPSWEGKGNIYTLLVVEQVKYNIWRSLELVHKSIQNWHYFEMTGKLLFE